MFIIKILFDCPIVIEYCVFPLTSLFEPIIDDSFTFSIIFCFPDIIVSSVVLTVFKLPPTNIFSFVSVFCCVPINKEFLFVLDILFNPEIMVSLLFVTVARLLPVTTTCELFDIILELPTNNE